MEHSQPFAEIIESSLSSWRAQCWQWDSIPAYGSIVTVKTNSRTLFGLVHDTSTASADTHRTVFTYKKTQEELKRDHPHIFEFLHTTFQCITLGYSEQEHVIYQPAPEPPKIHAFVMPATKTDLQSLFAHEQYLHTLFSHAQNLFSLDDVVLALMKHIADQDLLHDERFSRIIKTFSLLTGNDYRRLKLFLQRAQTMLQSRKRSC